MIRRAWMLCVLIPLVVTGGAQAHDSGPAIARALVALRQGTTFTFDPASPVDEQQVESINQRLSRSNGISVVVLPVDYSLSAVGAARELALHLSRPGTVIAILGGDLGATSTDIDGHLLGALVHQYQQVYNREGIVPALSGLIDGIEAARDAPEAGGGGVRLGVVLVTAAALVAASALALFALRRARRP
jgi:hypothetical protein